MTKSQKINKLRLEGLKKILTQRIVDNPSDELSQRLQRVELQLNPIVIPEPIVEPITE